MFFIHSCTFGYKLKMDLGSNLPSLRQISVINLSIYAYLILLLNYFLLSKVLSCVTGASSLHTSSDWYEFLFGFAVRQMIARVMLLGVLSICFNSNLEFLSGKLNSMDFLIKTYTLKIQQ